jgi:hypothetical protein
MIPLGLTMLSVLLPVCILAASVLLHLGRRNAFAAFLVLAFVISSAHFAMMFLASGHLPVSGNFEKFHALVLMLLLYLVTMLYLRKVNLISFSVVLGLVMLLLGSLFFQERILSEHLLIYDRLSPMLFFYFRKASMASFVIAASWYVSCLFAESRTEVQATAYERGKDFLLGGATLFMAGEFFGSIWAVQGWGDPWRWSKGFFIAAAIFLITMLILHVPGGIFQTLASRARLIIGAVCLILVLYIF